MDYPFLNLLFSLVLILSNSLSVGLYLLLRRANRTLSLWLLPFLAASLLPSLYIGILLYRSSTPNALRQTFLGMVVIAALVAGAVVLLYRIPLSPAAQAVLLTGLVLTILANLSLSYLLYRSLVAEPILSAPTGLAFWQSVTPKPSGIPARFLTLFCHHSSLY